MPEYIDVPIETDPEVLSGEVFDYLQARIPGWVPNAGNLETILTEALARIGAEIRDVASRVPVSVFRWFGPLVGVYPVDATSAVAQTTWTMIDDSGYTIPADTLIGIRAAGDQLVIFQTIDDVIVPPGDTMTAVGGVTAIAVTPGAAGSGLGTPGQEIELSSLLDYVTAVTLVAATTGGIDAEADFDYLNRLRTELQLLTPRPILPQDFAVLARNISGVARALAIDLYKPGTDETQRVTITGAPTSGGIRLTFSGQQTGAGAIVFDSNAGAVQTALEALSNIDVGDLLVTGGPFPATPIDVKFRGPKGGTDQPAMTVTSTLGGGSSPAAAVTTPTPGVAPETTRERAVTVALTDEVGQPVTSTAATAVDAYLQSLREVNFEVYVIDPTYTTIHVTFTVTIYDGFVPADVVAAAEAAVAAYLSPAAWGLPRTGDRFIWLQKTYVRYLELATVLNNTEGVDEVTALQLGVEGGALSTADVILSGAAPLPQPGTITGTAA